MNRRKFIRAATPLIPGMFLPMPSVHASGASEAFSFVLLGDLHFDRLKHHDLAWMNREKPDDVRQAREYSRVTSENLPQLFASLRETIAGLNQSAPTREALVAQLGDLVEGLCGSEELATQQDQEALDLMREALFRPQGPRSRGVSCREPWLGVVLGG